MVRFWSPRSSTLSSSIWTTHRHNNENKTQTTNSLKPSQDSTVCGKYIAQAHHHKDSFSNLLLANEPEDHLYNEHQKMAVINIYKQTLKALTSLPSGVDQWITNWINEVQSAFSLAGWSKFHSVTLLPGSWEPQPNCKMAPVLLKRSFWKTEPKQDWLTYSTQCRSFRRCSSQPISWLSTENSSKEAQLNKSWKLSQQTDLHAINRIFLHRTGFCMKVCRVQHKQNSHTLP